MNFVNKIILPIVVLMLVLAFAVVYMERQDEIDDDVVSVPVTAQTIPFVKIRNTYADLFASIEYTGNEEPRYDWRAYDEKCGPEILDQMTQGRIELRSQTYAGLTSDGEVLLTSNILCDSAIIEKPQSLQDRLITDLQKETDLAFSFIVAAGPNSGHRFTFNSSGGLTYHEAMLNACFLKEIVSEIHAPLFVEMCEEDPKLYSHEEMKELLEQKQESN